MSKHDTTTVAYISAHVQSQVLGVSQRFIGALRRVAAAVLGSWVECCFYSSDSKVTYTRGCAA